MGEARRMKKERPRGEPPDPGEDERAGFNLNRLEVGGVDEEEEVESHFLGDRALLYSHSAPDSTPTRRMMVFSGFVSGHRAVILLDTGANANFVSAQWAPHGPGGAANEGLH